jgi:cupin 2 domain-containing protein
LSKTKANDSDAALTDQLHTENHGVPAADGGSFSSSPVTVEGKPRIDFVVGKARQDVRMNENAPTPRGRYRHYKGKEYAVVGTAQHSETLEEFVVYRQEYGDHGLWVRPKRMFFETVTVAGREVPRFQFMEAGDETVGEGVENIFDDLPPHLPKELVQLLARGDDVRVERIVSRGHASPEGFWYDQQEHEWVIVLKGAARLQFEDGVVEMNPGDFLNIQAHRKHRVEWTTPDEPTIWLAVFYRGRG